MIHKIYDEGEIPSEGNLVLIQDTGFSKLMSFNLEKYFFSEIEDLERKTCCVIG